MIKMTFDLRKEHGKFTAIETPLHMIDSSSGNCESCGSDKPESLICVKSSDGLTLLVGSTCASILTSGKNPKVDSLLIGTGETYQDAEKTYIYITQAWLKNLGDYLFIVKESHINKYGHNVPVTFETDYNGGYHSGNWSDFLYSVYLQARKNNKISDKQYNAVNKVMAK